MKPELIAYLKEKSNSSFDVETNNCIQFTNDCWEIYYGFPYSKKYAETKKFEDAGFDCPLALFDAVLERSEKPQEGHLVGLSVPGDTYLAGLVSGFCVGQFSVFLGTKGVKYMPTKIIRYSWKNRDANI